MTQFVIKIKGRDNGEPYTDTINIEAPDEMSARMQAKETLLDGEKIMSVREGKEGKTIPPARG